MTLAVNECRKGVGGYASESSNVYRLELAVTEQFIQQASPDAEPAGCLSNGQQQTHVRHCDNPRQGFLG
jgi:hypothetical protein